MSRGGERRARPRAALGKRGFTLVELIVSMGIMVALIGLVIAIIMTAFGNYDRGATLTDSKQKVQSIYNFCEKRLAEASAVYIGSVPAGSQADSVIDFRDVPGRDRHLFFGNSLTNATDIFGDNFYGGCEVRVSIYCPQETVLHLTVELWDIRENKMLYKREGEFRLSGLSLAGKTVVNPPPETAPLSNPVIYFSK